MPPDALRLPPRTRPPRRPDAALDFELALQKQTAERAQRRRKWIKIAGSLAFFVSPFPAIVIGGNYAAAAATALLLPAGIGASIAFFGMTMTDHRRNTAEWGFTFPSKCLAYGMAPYLLPVFGSPLFVVVLVAWAAIAWLLTILGASVTAAIIDRWFYPRG